MAWGQYERRSERRLLFAEEFGGFQRLSISVCCADWSVVDPLEYLGPFLEVIRSPETSGPITGTALTSLTRFLDQDIIGVP